MKEKKPKVLETAKELHDTKTTLPSMETDHGNTVKVSRKRLKAQKKLKSLAEAPSLDAAVTTDESERSAVDVLNHSSHVKRLPRKSDCNSGVVRIIEKSRHKQVPRTDNIEEALQLDLGIGSGSW